jgi:hypothetical protein
MFPLESSASARPISPLAPSRACACTVAPVLSVLSRRTPSPWFSSRNRSPAVSVLMALIWPCIATERRPARLSVCMVFCARTPCPQKIAKQRSVGASRRFGKVIIMGPVAAAILRLQPVLTIHVVAQVLGARLHSGGSIGTIPCRNGNWVLLLCGLVGEPPGAPEAAPAASFHLLFKCRLAGVADRLHARRLSARDVVFPIVDEEN